MNRRLNIVRPIVAFLSSTLIAGYVFLILIALLRKGEYEAIIPASVFNIFMWGLFFWVAPILIHKCKGDAIPRLNSFVILSIVFGLFPIITIYLVGLDWWPWELKIILIGLVSGVVSGLLAGPAYWILRYYKHGRGSD